MDTCTYKKELVFSIIVSLVTLHATILRMIYFAFPQNRIDRDYFGLKMHLMAIFVAAMSVGLGASMIENSFLPDFVFWHNIPLIEVYLYSFIALAIGMVTIAIGLGVAYLFCIALYAVYQLLMKGFYKIKAVAPSLEDENGEPNTQIGVLYQSAKERWCKKIDWEW